MNTVRWLAATRPAFLSMTVLAVGLGFAFAGRYPVQISGLIVTTAILTLAGAMLVHGGANVLNDVADADNGSDSQNADRVAPFTGGSRFIQDGWLSRDQMLRFAWLLLALATLCGMILVFLCGPLLLWFGAGGMLLAIAYSLPPLQLMSRGLGEFAVIVAWMIIVAGSEFVILRRAEFSVWLGSLPFAVQTGLILLVNQIPDVRADRLAGKRNWVVRAGPANACWLYFGGMLASYGILLLCWQMGILPAASLIALGALPLGLIAVRQISLFWHAPQKLAPVIRLTLVQAHLVGLLIISGLVIERLFRIYP